MQQIKDRVERYRRQTQPKPPPGPALLVRRPRPSQKAMLPPPARRLPDTRFFEDSFFAWQGTGTVDIYDGAGLDPCFSVSMLRDVERETNVKVKWKTWESWEEMVWIEDDVSHSVSVCFGDSVSATSELNVRLRCSFGIAAGEPFLLHAIPVLVHPSCPPHPELPLCSSSEGFCSPDLTDDPPGVLQFIPAWHNPLTGVVESIDPCPQRARYWNHRIRVKELEHEFGTSEFLRYAQPRARKAILSHPDQATLR